MRNFSFSNLLGGKSTRAEESQATDDEDQTAAAEDGDEEDEAADESTAADDEEEQAAEDDEDDGEDDDDEGDEAAAFARGRRAERKRLGAILSSDAVNPGNLAQAASIAVNTSLTPKQAADILKAAPAGGSRLSQAMRGRGANPIAVSDGGGGAKGPNAKDLMAKRFAKK